MIRRVLMCVSTGLVMAGCGSWQRVGTESGPSPEQALTQILDMATVYKRLGRIAVGAPLPFIGNIVYAAGPGDSTIAIVGLSLENRSLGFQREGGAFVARYHVEITFQKQDGVPIRAALDETVQVSTFRETLRNDESVLFQQAFQLLPGPYQVAVALRDRNSSESNRAEVAAEVPAFPDGSTSAPIVAYEVTGRGSQADALSLVLNPRGTVAYGSDTLLAYIEGYRMPGPTAVLFEVRDESDSVVFQDSLHFSGGQDVDRKSTRLNSSH